ncbi:MAG: hypothetical protein K0R50_620 [Eubacterium sp.]|jgi:hypothetical protein|nr:hypothetical protein [Eubacterium sp.]
MKTRKVLGISSFILIILMIVLFVENKHQFLLGDFILAKIGVNAWSNGTTGLHYTAVISILLMVLGIMGVIIFKKDVHEKFGRFALYFLLIGALIFQPAYSSVYGLVKSNLGGLSSIEYMRKDSHLNFKTDDMNKQILYTGQIKLKNYSSNTNEFHIKLVLNEHFYDLVNTSEGKDITICDEFNKPVKFTLEPKAEVMLTPEFSIKQNDKFQNGGGSINMIDIILYNDEGEKKFLYKQY